jgi:hypothetical protein
MPQWMCTIVHCKSCTQGSSHSSWERPDRSEGDGYAADKIYTKVTTVKMQTWIERNSTYSHLYRVLYVVAQAMQSCSVYTIEAKLWRLTSINRTSHFYPLLVTLHALVICFAKHAILRFGVSRHSQHYTIDANVLNLAKIKTQTHCWAPEFKTSFWMSGRIRESVEVTSHAFMDTCASVACLEFWS